MILRDHKLTSPKCFIHLHRIQNQIHHGNLSSIFSCNNNDDTYHIFHIDLYGLYKQALFGDNTLEKPYWFFFRSVQKWNSWMKHFGKTKSYTKSLS